METLLLHLKPRTHGHEFPSQGHEPPLHTDWLILNAERKPLGEPASGTLMEAAGLALHRRVVVLAPTLDVLLTEAQIHTKKREHLMRAVPFALEEELAEDIDNLHFALGPRQPDDHYPIAVVRRPLMQNWLDQLSAAGIQPHALLPDVLALSLTPNIWSLLLEPERVLIRTGSFSGLSLDPDNLNLVLPELLEEAQAKPIALTLYRCNSDQRIEPAPNLTDGVIEQTLCAPTVFALGLEKNPGINLLQGPFAPKSEFGRLLKPWRVAAALLVAWLGLEFGKAIFEYQALATENERLKAAIEQVYRQTFPEAQRVINPQVQMAQQLEALKAAQADAGKTHFMRLLAAGGAAVQTAPGTRIEAVNYRDGRLEINLNANDLQVLERITETLTRSGLEASIESAETRGTQVNARLLIGSKTA